jgi:Carboxypeptidase regulatory-like domain/TonB dependent receptor
MSMTRGLRNAGVVLALVSLPSASALAQQGLGTIVGTVTDAATKKPVADVVVTATAPQLPGEQIVVTDSQGQFRIPQLPAGQYTLRFEKESFRPFSRSDIPLRIDTTVRVNTEILPDTAGQEEIVVVGKAPTVDVGSSNVGTNVGQDFVRNIAVARPTGRGGAARSFESLATVAPTATADEYGVGISGTTSPENGFVVDGLSVGNPAKGIIGTPLSMEFIGEVNVITGGYMPEYGRATGGVLNAVTKSGSNEFKGSVFANWAPGALQSQRTPVNTQGSAFSFTRQTWNIGDFGAELGGPILKDKLWFYVGLAPNFYREQVTKDVRKGQTTLGANGRYTIDRDENGFQIYNNIPGASTSRFGDQRGFQYLGKLTYAINPDHSLSLSVSGSPSSTGGNGSYGYDNESGGLLAVANGDYTAGTNLTTNDALDVALKMNSAFMDKRLLLDTTLGWHNQRVTSNAVDGSTVFDIGNQSTLAGTNWFRFRNQTTPDQVTRYIGPGSAEYNQAVYNAVLAACSGPDASVACTTNQYIKGAPQILSDALLNRMQGKVVGTLLLDGLGHHVLKAGVDVENIDYNSTRGYTGQGLLSQSTGGGRWDVSRSYGYLTGPDQAVLLNNVNSFTRSLTAGAFVQDSWSILDRVTLNAGVRLDQQVLYGSKGQIGINLPNQISPRIGLVYDVTQEGRSKLYANYARFYNSVPLNIMDRGFGNERQLNLSSLATRCVPNKTAPTAAEGDACMALANLAPTVYNPASDPNGIYHGTGVVQNMVDPDIKPQSLDEFVVGGEYEVLPRLRAGVSYVHREARNVVEDMSRDDGTTYFMGNPGQGIATDFPVATRNYDAVTLFAEKAFGDLWLAQASYTWSRLYGNYSGLFVPESGQLDPFANATYDLKALLDNQMGLLPGDRTHTIKFFGAREFVLSGNMSFNLGLSYTGQSGTPLNALAGYLLYGASESYIVERGTVGRNDFIHSFDGKLGFNVKVTPTNTLTLNVDVFNLFNFQGVSERDEQYTPLTVFPIVGKKGTGNGATTEAELDQALLGTTQQDQNGAARPFNEDAKNPNFLRPTAYQAPRAIRFGARVTF